MGSGMRKAAWHSANWSRGEILDCSIGTTIGIYIIERTEEERNPATALIDCVSRLRGENVLNLVRKLAQYSVVCVRSSIDDRFWWTRHEGLRDQRQYLDAFAVLIPDCTTRRIIRRIRRLRMRESEAVMIGQGSPRRTAIHVAH